MTTELKEITEQLAIVYGAKPADHQSAGVDSESVNMGKLAGPLWALVALGAITGNDTTIKCYAGATAGTKTTEIGFRYRKTGADQAAALSDQFGDFIDVAAGGNGIIFTDAATFDNRLLVLTVKPIDMPDGQPWLTIEVDDGSASGLFASIVMLGVPKFYSHNVPTVI